MAELYSYTMGTICALFALNSLEDRVLKWWTFMGLAVLIVVTRWLKN